MPPSQTRFRATLAAGLATGLVVLLGMTLWLRREMHQPAALRERLAILVVPEGTPLKRTIDALSAAGLIGSPSAFELLARGRGLAGRIQSGTHRLPGGLAPGDVLDLLVDGSTRIEFVTIPEGLRGDEIARLLETAGVGPAAGILALMRDAEFAASLGVPARGLEGYLFPDTYALGAEPRPREVLQRLVRRFFEVWEKGPAVQARQRGLKMAEVVTLASIIEEEAARAEERPTISAVFHNRLKRGMPLQSDPTVLYGVEGRAEGRIRSRDLKRATPYNTYMIRGLPPGPISNPGLGALEAAVAPEPGLRALYFVARNDGTHVFSETLAEHNRAVTRWQR